MKAPTRTKVPELDGPAMPAPKKFELASVDREGRPRLVERVEDIDLAGMRALWDPLPYAAHSEPVALSAPWWVASSYASDGVYCRRCMQPFMRIGAPGPGWPARYVLPRVGCYPAWLPDEARALVNPKQVDSLCWTWDPGKPLRLGGLVNEASSFVSIPRVGQATILEFLYRSRYAEDLNTMGMMGPLAETLGPALRFWWRSVNLPFGLSPMPSREGIAHLDSAIKRLVFDDPPKKRTGLKRKV